MRILLVLHARSPWSFEGKLQGQTDILLDSRGRDEAIVLAKELEGHGATYCIASDLSRALGTALIVAGRLRIPDYRDARLREGNFGTLEGKTRAEIAEVYTPTRRDAPDGTWHGSYAEYDFTRFGGETRNQVLARHLAVLRELQGEGVPLLVGHGCGFNTLLWELGECAPLRRGEVREIEFEK